MTKYNITFKSDRFHIVYKTINNINKKIYIGIHSTNKIDDGYLGSGWALKKAITKYGREAFSRETLYVFPTRKEAMMKEAELVNEDFIKQSSNYNLVVGGSGTLDQFGEKNPMYGKPSKRAKEVVAIHKDGRVVEASSIQELSKLIHIARGNIRNLIKKGIQGKRGWKVSPAKI